MKNESESDKDGQVVDLQGFDQVFKTDKSPEAASLWTLEVRGQYQRYVFAQGDAQLMYSIPDQMWSLVIISCKFPKLYDHVRYVLQSLVYYVESSAPDSELQLEIALHGMAYQAVIPLREVPQLEIQDNYVSGTLRGKEKRILNSVTIRRSGSK